MWGKFFLVTTGLISLLYFLFPENFQLFDTKNSAVLGVKKINAQINKSSVETALLIHCIDRGRLPEDLNNLYDGYLKDTIKIDLSGLFEYRIISNKDCEYQIQPK